MRVIYANTAVLLILILGKSSLCSQEPTQASGATRIGAAMYVPGQDPVLGGVPSGKPTGELLSLSLAEAIERGLKFNLAAILGEQSVRLAQGAERRNRGEMLPYISAGVSESQQQVNLKAFGFGGFPGSPTIVGPFSVFDTRLYLSQAVIDFKVIHNSRAGTERLEAAEQSYRGIRNRIVLACGALYLQAVAGKSRIEAARVQLQTAQELSDLAVDLKEAGVAPGIEVLRAQVELQSHQQRLIVAQNEFAQDKLVLARAIGLPLGQQFQLSDDLAYAAVPPMTVEGALERAYRDRSDYHSALAQVRAAESAKKAARAEQLPSLRLAGNYGINGPGPGWSHGSYAIGATLRIPIFEGDQVRAKVIEADAAVNQRRAEAEDLRARIYYEVQTAFLDLQAAEERVKVAGGSVKLAQEQLLQAQDRFSAGVASNIEVIQAQEALANMTEEQIASLYAHNMAKGGLAQAMGAAESSFLQFIKGN